MASSSGVVLHITPGPHGSWVITGEGHETPLSRHGDVTAALRAATVLVTEEYGSGDVLVHDRYHHTHLHRCGARRR